MCNKPGILSDSLDLEDDNYYDEQYIQEEIGEETVNAYVSFLLGNYAIEG